MTNTTTYGQVPAIQRYSIGYHSDEWGVRSLSPSGIYDDAGPWVRYADHAAEFRRLHAQQPAPAGATEEVENLRKALVYVAFALHDTPQYMLAQGITLIDGDTVRVSRDGWTVEASVNPHRQPAPAPQQAGTAEVVECGNLYAKVKLRGDAFGSTNVGDVFYSTPQPSPTAQAADSVLEDAVLLALTALHTCTTSGYVDVDGDFIRTRYFDQVAVDAAIRAIAARNQGGA